MSELYTVKHALDGDYYRPATPAEIAEALGGVINTPVAVVKIVGFDFTNGRKMITAEIVGDGKPRIRTSAIMGLYEAEQDHTALTGADDETE